MEQRFWQDGERCWPAKASARVVFIFASALIWSVAGSEPVTAQVNKAPARIDPNQTQKTFDAYLEEQQRRKEAALPERQTAQPADGLDTTPQFKLTSVSITGAKALPIDALAATYQSYIGKMVSFADLAAISEKMSDLYREAGYHLSRAIVPPQEIKGGRLLIQVIEGSISEIVLKGEGAEQFGARRLLDAVRAEQPSRLETLERRLLLVNDIPGVRVSDTGLEEIGGATGRFRLIVHLETWHVFAAVGVDNRGTDAVGPVQAYFASALNSVIRDSDTLGLNLSTIPDATREQRFNRLWYEAPIRDNGARIGAAVSYNEIWPGDYRRQSRTRTQIESYEIWGSIVPRRSRESSLWLTVTARITNDSERDMYGMNYDDQIRALSLTGVYQRNDAFRGSNYFTATLTQGVDIFGASEKGDPLLSRYDGSADFSKLNLSVARDQKLSGPWSLYASAAGQLSSTALLSSEEFYLGGPIFGRGYDPGETSGDHGVAGSLELRFDQKLNDDFVERYQLYGFIDGGAVWNIRDGEDDTLSLSSAGFGARFHLARDWRAGVEIALPLDYRSPVNEDRDARIFFSLSHSLKACPSWTSASCF